MQLGTFRVIAEPGGFGRCHWREARGFRAYRWRRGRGACPRDRQARMDQRERADKIEPTLAAEPIENAEASEPTDPTDRIEPAEPMDRIEPDEPIDRIDPLDPMLKMEPADPGERDEPAGICITIFGRQDTSRTSRAECCHVAASRPEIRAQSGMTGCFRGAHEYGG